MLRLYGQSYVQSDYFVRAMQYYRRKFDNVVFVVATDDMDWAVDNIKNTNDDVLFLGSRDAMDVNKEGLENI